MDAYSKRNLGALSYEANICRGSRLECSVEKVFSETLQNTQENTCARVSAAGVFL